MIHDQQRDSFHFRRRRKPQQSLTVTERSNAFEYPAFRRHAIFRADHFQRSFIPLCSNTIASAPSQ